MSAFLTNMLARRDAIAIELAALSASAAGGKPNANGEGGGVDHVGYKDGLYRELAAIEAAIDGYHRTAATMAGPFEIVETGVPL